MSRLLSPGSYHGVVINRHESDDCLFTEDRYEPDSVAPVHTHSWPTVTVVLNGRFDEVIDDSVTTCLPGHVLFRPRDTTHSDTFHPRMATRLFNIELDPALVGCESQRRTTRMTGRAAGLAVEIRSSLIREAGVTRSVRDLTARLSEEIAAWVREPAAGEPSWLGSVDSVIEAGCGSSLDLGSLAATAGVHPVHLSRTHRRFRGETIRSRITRLRVARATRLLLDADAPLAEIALEAGFADQSHMTRAFRSVTGSTPGTFRSAGEGSDRVR